MAKSACPHAETTRGVLQWDVARKGENSLYSINVSVTICCACGRVELYCESPRQVCDWLVGSSAKDGKESSGKPNGLGSRKRRPSQKKSGP